MKCFCFGLLLLYQCECQEPPKTTTVVCPPVIEWRVDLQKKAAAEIRTLPKGSATQQLITRAIEQRNVNRRCLETRK